MRHVTTLVAQRILLINSHKAYFKQSMPYARYNQKFTFILRSRCNLTLIQCHLKAFYVISNEQTFCCAQNERIQMIDDVFALLSAFQATALES